MCLTTRLTKPFVAKKDIVCYKRLIPSSFGVYITPFLHIPVELNTMLEAGSDKSYEGTEWEYGFKHAIEGGFIHAYLGSQYKICFKAIIPAGTEFYIDDGCMEICARKMFITDEEVKMAKIPDCKSVIRELFNDYFSDLFTESITGVGIGYYYLSDGSYVNPKDITEERKKDVIGIISHIREDKAWVVSLNETRLEWYEAVRWVNNYYTKGTEPGDWYLGNVDEVRQMILNMFLINVSLSLLNTSVLLGSSDCFWSSSEYNSFYYCSVCTCLGNVFNNYKDANCNVTPFLCKDI